MRFYRNLLRPLLFGLDPERAHAVVFFYLKFILRIPGLNYMFRRYFSLKKSTPLSKNICGIEFPNSVGLAAGFDKDAKYLHELAALGFGFIEVGTVTPLPQSGNEKPRLFRLKEDEALINRMGFNNEGVIKMHENLLKKPKGILVGINIGKNKSTPIENAFSDYKICFTALYSLADYFAINVSSPNTPGLRSLQQKEPLFNLLKSLNELNSELSKQNRINRKPVFLKIAPDLSNEEIDVTIDACLANSIDGIIAVNTTISRENLLTNVSTLKEIGAGGLSGKPLKERSDSVISYVRKKAGERLKIIGVGGIGSPEDALQKLTCGADLVQIYSGFIYEGPMLVKKINQAILKNL